MQIDLNTYHKNMDSQNDEAIAPAPVADALLLLIPREDIEHYYWQGTPKLYQG
jgi:hypothetical protein